MMRSGITTGAEHVLIAPDLHIEPLITALVGLIDCTASLGDLEVSICVIVYLTCQIDSCQIDSCVEIRK